MQAQALVSCRLSVVSCQYGNYAAATTIDARQYSYDFVSAKLSAGSLNGTDN
jgi:hypothetical protein